MQIVWSDINPSVRPGDAKVPAGDIAALRALDANDPGGIAMRDPVGK